MTDARAESSPTSTSFWKRWRLLFVLELAAGAFMSLGLWLASLWVPDFISPLWLLLPASYQWQFAGTIWEVRLRGKHVPTRRDEHWLILVQLILNFALFALYAALFAITPSARLLFFWGLALGMLTLPVAMARLLPPKREVAPATGVAAGAAPSLTKAGAYGLLLSHTLLTLIYLNVFYAGLGPSMDIANMVVVFILACMTAEQPLFTNHRQLMENLGVQVRVRETCLFALITVFLIVLGLAWMPLPSIIMFALAVVCVGSAWLKCQSEVWAQRHLDDPNPKPRERQPLFSPLFPKHYQAEKTSPIGPKETDKARTP